MFLVPAAVFARSSGYFIASSTILGQEVLSRQKVLLDELQTQLELLVGCSVCVEPLDESTYIWHIIDHHCPGEILLARAKGTPPHQGWRKVRRRPIFPKPRYYEVCHFYRREAGCRRHGQCTFASSPEEAMVWTFERQNSIPRLWLKAEVQNNFYPCPLRSQSTVEKIWAEFGGYFQEICKACFENSCPPQMTRWRSNLVCPEHPSSGSILVHVASEDHRVVIKPKPLRSFLMEYCMVVSRGQPCQQGVTDCIYAHSDVEMAVWEAEARDYLFRPDLIQTTLESEGRARVSRKDGGGYESPISSARIHLDCKACHVPFGSQESFKNHFSSIEHKLRLSYEQGALWEHRPPTIGVSEFKLCSRQDICLYRNVCTKAHSLGELQEWILRALTIQMREDSAWKHGLFFQHLLSREYQDNGNEMLVRSRSVRDITIHCGQPLQCQEEDKKSQRSWKFIIHSKGRRPLRYVALLKQHMGAMFSLVGPELLPGQLYAQGSKFRVHGAAVMTFHVEVRVECATIGSYDQWIAFDFGCQPVLVQKLHVQVGQKEAPAVLPTFIQDHGCLLERTHWHSGNRCVVPSVARTTEQVKLLAKYNVSSQELDSYKSIASTKIPITLANYRDRMHQLLYIEEEAQQQLVARLNLQVQGTLSSKVQTPAMGMKFEAQGKSYVKGRIPCSLTPDTDQGSLLSKAVTTAYVVPVPEPDNRVYEVQVKVKTTSELHMWLLLPDYCCSALGLKDGDSQLMEIQFQIDRMVFGKWHQAIDSLHDERVVVPDIPACSLPSLMPPTQEIFYNAKQKQAISYITGTTRGKRQVPPLLICGPFGTGKTHTLAWAALEVIKQPNAKVLICTHTDSAADVYIREYFHVYATAGHPEAVPLRVKNMESFFHQTDPTTLKYCCVSEDGCSFRFPTQDELEQHSVIVTTTTSSHSLRVPPGFFSHILIDEAAQMLECEAIMPLAYATRDTRIALAGDHMQSSPKLYSVGDTESAGYSLFTRLFQHYEQETHELASQCRIIFHENYRTTKAIIPFVFHNFYGASKIPVQDSGIPEHPWQYPLMFCYVSGTPERDMSMASWLNKAEIVEVIKRVQEFYEGWVYQWGSPDQKQICVVSHGSQVKRLKEELGKKQLGEVVVENFENVPGREFRVVILSTVHTQESLLSNSATHLEFFNEPKLLNIVMTRAQSQLVVVGDLRALCAFGHCRKIWKNFIQETLEQGNVLPTYLKMEDVEQSSLLRLAWQNRLNPEDATRENLLEEEDNHSVITSWVSDA